jgi:hypothetical protein
MTDRDLLLALFTLVGALAERLTGERPTVRLEVEPGKWANFYPFTSRVTWKKADEVCPPTA